MPCRRQPLPCTAKVASFVPCSTVSIESWRKFRVSDRRSKTFDELPAVSRVDERGAGEINVSLLLLALILLFALGLLPHWFYSSTWSYRPAGAATVLLIFVTLLT